LARYIGGSLFVAAIATVYKSATIDRVNGGASRSAALAAGLSRSCLVLAISCGAGIALALLMARHRQGRPKAVDLAAAAAASAHTIPTRPVTSAGASA
jgi:hypothetical protein